MPKNARASMKSSPALRPKAAAKKAVRSTEAMPPPENPASRLTSPISFLPDSPIQPVAEAFLKPKVTVRPKASPAKPVADTRRTPPDSPISSLIAEIRHCHRRRRFAMKIQQKLDRALESFIRVYGTNWSPDLDEKERTRINKEVAAIIKRCRDGKPEAGDLQFVETIVTSDQARAPADKMRAAMEKQMEEKAKELPVFSWLQAIRGAGALGLATIVAETGDLSNYANPAKIWKRLGFHVYEGFAMSSWKRGTWRPRSLTSEEWIENPFSGSRYALMSQIATWLVNAQWIGAAKTESGEGEPNGHYGQIYAARRKHAIETHPDWTDGHRRKDALRITMKEFLKDLWVEWRRVSAAQFKEAAE